MKTHLSLIALLTYTFTFTSWAYRIDTHIFAVNSVGDLLEFDHINVNSTPTWGIPKGYKIGNGWNFKQLFAGDSRAVVAGNSKADIYGIKPNGDLYYQQRGMSSWTYTGKQIGNGWNFKQIFAGDGGTIYAIANNGDMKFYKYTGLGNGNLTWGSGTGNRIGTGWNFKQVFSGGDGTIFAVKSNGDLMFYKYGGTSNGSTNWPITSKKIGNGFNFDTVFAGANYTTFPQTPIQTNYTVYGVKSNGDLYFNIYTGAPNGSATWLWSSMQQIDTGWNNFRQIIASTNKTPEPP
jgi:hypothetical protein